MQLEYKKRMRLATTVAVLMLAITSALMPQAWAGTVASAQTTLPNPGSSGLSGALRVYVPFPFAVNGKTMNAGEYYISRDGEHFVAIKDGSGKNTIFVLTHSVVTTEQQTSAPKLVFHRYGDNYFLAQAWLSYSDDGRELSASGAERKQAKEYRDTSTTIEVGR